MKLSRNGEPMNDTTRDELLKKGRRAHDLHEQVAVMLDDMSTLDISDTADKVIDVVTAARDAEIREALLSDRAVGMLLTAVEDDSVLAMALSARKQRGDSVVCTATLSMGRDWLTAALDAIGLGDGTGGQGDVGITLRSSEERAKLRREALDMFGDYEYESEWDTQR